MTKVNPWHFMNAWVYHDNSECTAGCTIPEPPRTPGTGAKRRCGECTGLNRRDDDTRRQAKQG
jgi:hypothetical protein